MVGWFGFLINAITWLLLAIADPIDVGNHTIANPIGVIPVETILTYILALFVLFLSTLGAALVSLFLRFMQAGNSERRQIKWVLYVAAIFVTAMLYSFVAQNNFGGMVIGLSALGFPFAIGIAILRYRLYDIDLIIRRTIQYALLSALLALLYYGSVTLLQGIFTALGGSQTTAATVILTLAIAALFNPLRRRIQDFIDRRFYRQKYDTGKALASFSEAARSETDLQALVDRLILVVQETTQPESVLVWLAPAAKRQHGEDGLSTTNQRTAG
jgi:hypothetical protein